MIAVLADRIECTTLAEASWLRRHRCNVTVVHVRKPENPRRELLGPGKLKTCRRCAVEFRILTRGDCRAVHCTDCRTAPRSRAKARPLVIPPIAVVALADTCACGARLDCGRCAECSGVGVWA